jgi:hypothetical protein
MVTVGATVVVVVAPTMVDVVDVDDGDVVVVEPVPGNVVDVVDVNAENVGMVDVDEPG